MPTAELDQAPNDVGQFLTQYRSAQKPASDDDDEGDDVGSFLKQYRAAAPKPASAGSKIATPDVVAARANKDKTSTGKAVENLRAEGYTTRDFDESDPRSVTNPAPYPTPASEPEPQSTIPIVPFKSPVPTQPLDQRAAKLGASMLPPLTPPAQDTTSTPLNVFEGAPQRPPSQQQSTKEELPPQVSQDELAKNVMKMGAPGALGAQAAQGVDVTNLPTTQGAGADFAQSMMTGSKKLPLPYMAPDGSLRTMSVGDFKKLADDYLNDPTIPKSTGTAMAAGMAADTVQTLNDIFFSPMGIASSVTGLAAARALQTAGKEGATAIKLGQEYQDMVRSGASADELAEQEQLFREAVAKASAAKNVTVGARVGLKAAGGGFMAQGAGQVVSGIQRKDYPTILQGLGGIALGGYDFARDGLSDVETQVQGETAKAATDNLKNEAPSEEPTVPFRAPGAEKNVTAQGSHEIIRPPQLPAPREEVAPEQAATPPRQGSDTTATARTVGAGEALTPEKPETLQAQVDALAEGTNPVVYVPKGQAAPEAPEGAKVTVVGGDQPGAGTYIHDDSVTPQEIKQAVKDGTYGELLGNTQTKSAAVSGNAPVAVTARTDDGTEAKASVVDGTRPDAVATQTAALQSQFPDAKVGVETPEQVVEGRQSTAIQKPSVIDLNKPIPDDVARILNKRIGQANGGTPPFPLSGLKKLTTGQVLQGFGKVGLDDEVLRESASALYAAGYRQIGHIKITGEGLELPSSGEATTTPIDLTPAASRETPQTGEGDENDVDEFLQQHREARSIIKPQAEELSLLGGKLKHIDPHVADALNGLADGRYFSREDLLKIASGIRDAKTSADLRSIVNEFGSTAASKTAAPAETSATSKAPETTAAPQASNGEQPVREHVEQVRERSEGVREAAGENGNQLGPKEAPAKVGDHVTAKSGPLKGKTVEVTKVGATGVYGTSEDGGPIRFLKTGEFGPLLDDQGKPITTGPGTPLRDAFDTAGTRIQQLADVIRENVGGSKPINERMDYADRVAEQQAKAKDETTAALGHVKGAMAAMWDAYTKPPKWTDYEDALGKYQGAIQKSAHGLKQFAAQIKKAVPDPKRREAITAFIEAAGDRATLEKWANEAKPKFRAGYKAALTLTNVEQTIARNIIATQDERFELDKAAGLLEHEVDNYVMHAWKRENPYTKKLVSNVRAQMLQTKPSFTKQRVFGTFFDGEKAGYSPVSKDIGFLFAAREHAADQAIAARSFIKSMLEGKASDGRPLVAVSGSGRPIAEEEKPAKAYLIDAKTKPEDVADYKSIDHPALRKWNWAQNDSTGTPIFVKGDLVVHPEAYSHLKNVLGKSALRSFAPFHAIQAISSHFKATELSFSMFHQTQESLHAVFHRVNPFTTKPIDFSNPKQAKLIDHGLQVASFDAQQAFGEGLGAGVPNRLPIVGKYLQRYNEYLFGDFIPRLKMAMAEHALDRNFKRYAGKMSEDQIYALTANQANAAFGELNYTMLGRNKTMQDVMRMALLAPDFLEARGRFVGQALKPYGREQALALITGALGMYVAARILNQLLTGNPRWEAQNVFDVVYKGRAYTLRSVPADIIHLFTDPRGFIYNRLNPVYGRGAIEGITGRDKYGRKQSVGQQVRDTLSGGLPIPVQGLSKGNESGPLETVLSSTGLSTFPYKSPAERLAQRYTLDAMPLGEESKDRKDANHEARSLEEKLRKKEISAREVTEARKEGKITESDQKRILARAARTPLQNSFRSLTPQQAMEVWDKADADERKQIRPLLANKLSRLGSVPQTERAKLKSRIFTALHGAVRSSSSVVPRHAPGSQ